MAQVVPIRSAAGAAPANTNAEAPAQKGPNLVLLAGVGVAAWLAFTWWKRGENEGRLEKSMERTDARLAAMEPPPSYYAAPPPPLYAYPFAGHWPHR